MSQREEVYAHRSLETGGTACHAGPHGGRARAGRETEEKVGGAWQSLYEGSNGKEWARQVGS